MSSGTNAHQTDLVKGAVGVLATAVQGGVDRVTVTPASSDTGHIDIRSSNCSAASIPARAICSFRVSNATGKTHVGTMTTCVAPLNDGTTVDEATQTSMLRAAGVALGDTSGLKLNSVSCVGGVDSDDGVRQLSAQELHRRRLASNCGPTFATSNITSINKYSCQYYGEQVDEFGQKVFETINITLVSTTILCQNVCLTFCLWIVVQVCDDCLKTDHPERCRHKLASMPRWLSSKKVEVVRQLLAEVCARKVDPRSATAWAAADTAPSCSAGPGYAAARGTARSLRLTLRMPDSPRMCAEPWHLGRWFRKGNN